LKKIQGFLLAFSALSSANLSRGNGFFPFWGIQSAISFRHCIFLSMDVIGSNFLAQFPVCDYQDHASDGATHFSTRENHDCEFFIHFPTVQRNLFVILSVCYSYLFFSSDERREQSPILQGQEKSRRKLVIVSTMFIGKNGHIRVRNR
jgi:hypothetical protein